MMCGGVVVDDVWWCGVECGGVEWMMSGGVAVDVWRCGVEEWMTSKSTRCFSNIFENSTRYRCSSQVLMSYQGVERERIGGFGRERETGWGGSAVGGGAAGVGGRVGRSGLGNRGVRVDEESVHLIRHRAMLLLSDEHV